MADQKTPRELESIAQYAIGHPDSELPTEALVDTDAVRIARKVMRREMESEEHVPGAMAYAEIIWNYERAKRAIENYDDGIRG